MIEFSRIPAPCLRLQTHVSKGISPYNLGSSAVPKVHQNRSACQSEQLAYATALQASLPK